MIIDTARLTIRIKTRSSNMTAAYPENGLVARWQHKESARLCDLVRQIEELNTEVTNAHAAAMANSTDRAKEMSDVLAVINGEA